jgi:hypothetical protein
MPPRIPDDIIDGDQVRRGRMAFHVRVMPRDSHSPELIAIACTADAEKDVVARRAGRDRVHQIDASWEACDSFSLEQTLPQEYRPLICRNSTC